MFQIPPSMLQEVPWSLWENKRTIELDRQYKLRHLLCTKFNHQHHMGFHEDRLEWSLSTVSVTKKEQKEKGKEEKRIYLYTHAPTFTHWSKRSWRRQLKLSGDPDHHLSPAKEWKNSGAPKLILLRSCAMEGKGPASLLQILQWDPPGEFMTFDYLDLPDL